MSRPDQVKLPPCLRGDKQTLNNSQTFGFLRFGLLIDCDVERDFLVSVASHSDKELFLFFAPRKDLKTDQFSLFNLHVFTDKTGTLDEFGHGLGESVADLKFSATSVFGVSALTYERRLTMDELFSGNQKIITFIGGHGDLDVRDSHTYFFSKGELHAYFGMLHSSDDNAKYCSMFPVILDVPTSSKKLCTSFGPRK